MELGLALYDKDWEMRGWSISPCKRQVWTRLYFDSDDVDAWNHLPKEGVMSRTWTARVPAKTARV